MLYETVERLFHKLPYHAIENLALIELNNNLVVFYQTFTLGNLYLSQDSPQSIQVEILFPLWACLGLKEENNFIKLSVSCPLSCLFPEIFIFRIFLDKTCLHCLVKLVLLNKNFQSMKICGKFPKNVLCHY